MIGFLAAIIICLIGIIGNLITITALTNKQSNRCLNNHSMTTMFVINLAITDLIFSLLIMPLQSGRYLTRSWPFGKLLCQLYPLFYYGTVATSLMLITAITINRYVSKKNVAKQSILNRIFSSSSFLLNYPENNHRFVLIAFNNHYCRIYNRRNVIIMIIFCWLFSYTLVSIPVFGLYGRTGYQSNTFSCTILRDKQNRSPKKFLFILGFFLPMITIVYCYGMILFHIRRQRRQHNHHLLFNNQTNRTTTTTKTMMITNQTSNRDIRLTLLICIVFGAFLACFLPLFIGNVFIPDDR